MEESRAEAIVELYKRPDWSRSEKAEILRVADKRDKERDFRPIRILAILCKGPSSPGGRCEALFQAVTLV